MRPSYQRRLCENLGLLLAVNERRVVLAGAGQ
jgi:hypothetical protein